MPAPPWPGGGSGSEEPALQVIVDSGNAAGQRAGPEEGWWRGGSWGRSWQRRRWSAPGGRWWGGGERGTGETSGPKGVATGLG